MKFLHARILTVIYLCLSAPFAFALSWSGLPAKDTGSYVSPFYEDNERCFKCHGQGKYKYSNDQLGTEINALMCTERITKREEFYISNHRSFGCTDCHSTDYGTFPHPGELRMELKYNCLDCHGGDDKYSSFNFETIDSDYRESIHFRLEEDGFTCWKCHNPHTYKISIRDSKNLKETILYDNAICLNCHSDFSRFQLLSDRDEINLMETHEWLPDQTNHFRNVRCIECHTRINDSLLVSHMVLSKDKAVKLCNECHSQNSMLMSTLYKFQSKEQRQDGFFNGIILNQSYVIGANRNEYLNILSIVIFAFVILIICVHIYFRLSGKAK
ncbi:MAG: hypothetical protein H6Q23_685 [Bacteroidetes bacterium]|nr:hypothetical protein [Bacteroidota bacterium]